MIRPQSLSLGLLVLLTCVGVSRGQVCQYGLGDYSSSHDACLALQKEALKRVGSAKTICYSANSLVQWSKNSKQPVGAFATMRVGARMAMKGFTPLYSCERADLVVRIDYDDMDGTVKLNVTHADSGESVFHEERSVSDLSSDVSRMSSHFQTMVSNARAAAKAAIEQAEVKRKEETFFTSLPKHWYHLIACNLGAIPPCSRGAAVDVSIVGNVLYESAKADDVLGEPSIKSKVSCTVERGTGETTPWAGDCTYALFWNNETTPACTVKTAEVITSISSKEITGRSQRVDFTPLRQDPPRCPVPGTESHDFTLTPDEEKR
jgi:hypothetical protein